MKAVRLQALTKDYLVGFWRPRPHRALDHVSLDVAPGEVVGYLGPNGSGKTTTLKLLMQLIYPTSGVAEILGRPAGDVAVRRRVGFLPETPYFYDNVTAEELLVYFGGLFGYTAAESRRRAGRLLDRVGIGAERRRLLRKYSKGMLQRVGIAQALINDPEVIFLDEPMSGLDPLGRRDVRDIILSLRDEGRTLLFSSHILSDVESVCSHVAILTKGRLVVSGRISDLGLDVQGWELVVGGVDESHLAPFKANVQSLTRVTDGRYVLELPVDLPPERIVADLARIGAHIISLNPRHETLEDYFVRQVGANTTPSAAVHESA